MGLTSIAEEEELNTEKKLYMCVWKVAYESMSATYERDNRETEEIESSTTPTVTCRMRVRCCPNRHDQRTRPLDARYDALPTCVRGSTRRIWRLQ